MPRTQQQRREETIARLLDASIDTIIDVGYARASAAVIAKRAQVSDGALFRHFPTMADFMTATAREVMRRQLEFVTSRVAEMSTEGALEAAVRIQWEATSNATNAVIFELMVAARTDEKLRAPMEAMLAEYAINIHETASAFPGADRFDEDMFATLVAIITNSFNGAALVRPVLSQPDAEAKQIDLLIDVMRKLG